MGDCCGATCVSQGNAGVVETIGGKFSRVIGPGCTCLNPGSEKLSGQISFKTQYMATTLECPTMDSATVRCVIGTVYKVIPSLVHQAFYKLTATREQINSYIVANLRSEIRGIKLDDLFEYRQQLSERLNSYLAPVVANFGHEIVEILVLEIEPTGQVKYAINEQKTQFYLRMGNRFRAEADRMRTIKDAEAKAESDRLRGVGQAEATKAISSAMQEGLANGNGDIGEKEVMSLMVMLQYFDMVKDMAGGNPHSPIYFMPPQNGVGGENYTTRMRQIKGLMNYKKRQPVSHDDI